MAMQDTYKPISFEEYKKQRIDYSKTHSQVQRGLSGEILPTAGMVVGGAYGGIPGAALGGAAGEFAQQSIEKVRGVRGEYDPSQIAASGVTGGVLEGGTRGVVKAGAYGIKVMRPSIIKFLSKFSGYADGVIEKALARAPGVVETLKGGEEALADIVRRSAAGVVKFARDTMDASKKEISDIAKRESLGGPGQEASRNVILKEAKNFVSSMARRFNQDHNIGVTKEGELLFSRMNRPSRIVSGADQSAITEGFSFLRTIRENTSILHIDSIFERLIALKTKTPTGTVTGPETRAILGEMINEIQQFVRKTYPAYAEHLTDNLPRRIMVNEAKDFFGGVANPSPKEVSRISTRLLQLYNTGRLPVRESLEKVGGEIGEDISGGAAGALMKTGEQFSIRAPALTRRALLQKMVEYFPRAALKNYAKTGKITGDLLNDPYIKAASNITGKSGKMLLTEIVNIMEVKYPDVPEEFTPSPQIETP